MRKITITFAFLSLFWACGDTICPPDEKVGDLELTESTKSFNPYESGDRLVFKSDSGDSLIFEATNGLEISRDALCVRELCTEPQIKGNTTCEFYESEANRLVFSTAAQTATIDFLLFSDVVRKNAREFYQSMRISISQENFIEQASILTDSINVQNLENENVEILNYFQFVGDLEINGQNFQNVFVYNRSLVTLYYSKALGLLSFETPDAVWMLSN